MTVRAFIAVEVQANEEFSNFQNALNDTGARLRLTDPNNLHITLKFLGDIEDDMVNNVEKSMIRSVSGMQPIFSTLQGTGVFPSEEKVRVMWIGVDGGESLMDIADSLEDELEDYGFDREGRTFVPHLTVARTKFDRQRGPDPNISKLLPVVEEYSSHMFGAFKVDNIKLIKSELSKKGPVYSIIREVPFF